MCDLGQCFYVKRLSQSLTVEEHAAAQACCAVLEIPAVLGVISSTLRVLCLVELWDARVVTSSRGIAVGVHHPEVAFPATHVCAGHKAFRECQAANCQPRDTAKGHFWSTAAKKVTAAVRQNKHTSLAVSSHPN